MQNAIVKLILSVAVIKKVGRMPQWLQTLSDNQSTKFQIFATTVSCAFILLPPKSKAVNPYLLIHSFYCKSHQICASSKCINGACS